MHAQNDVNPNILRMLNDICLRLTRALSLKSAFGAYAKQQCDKVIFYTSICLTLFNDCVNGQ